LLDEALSAAGAIWRFWQQRGHFAEARGIYDRLLALPGASPAARAKALIGGGGIAYWQNDFSVVGPWYQEAVDLYSSVGDTAGMAEAYFNLSYVPLLEGDLPEAERISAEAVDLFTQVGDEAGIAKSEQVVAFVHYYSADPAESLDALSHAVEIYRRMGARFLLADALTAAALPAANLAQWADVADKMHESLDIFESIGNEVGVAMVMAIQASSMGFTGQAEDAARLFGASDALRERLGAGAPTQLVNTDAYRRSAVEALGMARFDELAAQGNALSYKDALDLARAWVPPAEAPPLPPPEPWGKEAARRALAAESAK
jgi:tetratricopeptide (TPR) repeat protein